MEDANSESRSGASRGTERTQSVLRGVGSATLRRLRLTRERAGDVFGSTAKRLIESAPAERVSSALDTRRVLKKADAAHARGNALMAYRLLDHELRAKPSNEQLAVAFWHTCVKLERASEASDAVLRVIRQRAAAGDLSGAARLWCELTDVVADAHADAGTLVRMAAVLRESAPDRAIRAFRAALEPDTPGLTPGLATRLVELARDLDPHAASLAAQWVLQSGDLAEAKRVRLEAWVTDLEHEMAGDAAQTRTDTNAVVSDLGDTESDAKSVHPIGTGQNTPATFDEDRVVEPTVEAFAPLTRFSDVKATEAVSQFLDETCVHLQTHDGRSARLGFAKIQAVAVAAVAGLAEHPVVVIDLVLNWHSCDDEQLRLVRLRGDRFTASLPNHAEPEDLHAILADLFSRTAAEPLPDSGAASGGAIRHYDDIGSYEREVLLAG